MGIIGIVLGTLIGVLFFHFAILLIPYIMQALVLNRFNELANGKGTIVAWIPIVNIYLLGKLTVNKLVGWLLVMFSFFGGSIITQVNGVQIIRIFFPEQVEIICTIFPENISKIIALLYSITYFGLFIYAMVKFIKLEKSTKSSAKSSLRQEKTANQVGILNMNQTQVSEVKTYTESAQQQVSNQATVVSNEFTRSQVDNESVTANLTQNQSDAPFDNWM